MLRFYFLLFMCLLTSLFIGASQPRNVSAKIMYVVEKTWINIRSGTTMEHLVVAKTQSGEPLKILGQEGEWYHVQTPRGEVGWVAKSLLKEEKPLTEQVEELTKKTEEQSTLIAKLTGENNSLRKRAQLFKINQAELNRLKTENLRLKKHKDLLWVAVGAGILFVGWIIGLITGSFYRKSKPKYHYSID